MVDGAVRPVLDDAGRAGAEPFVKTQPVRPEQLLPAFGAEMPADAADRHRDQVWLAVAHAASLCWSWCNTSSQCVAPTATLKLSITRCRPACPNMRRRAGSR